MCQLPMWSPESVMYHAVVSIDESKYNASPCRLRFIKPRSIAAISVFTSIRPRLMGAVVQILDDYKLGGRPVLLGEITRLFKSYYI